MYMQALLECCCGVDVHRDMIEVCILKGESDQPSAIRAQFKTTKSDLKAFVAWLTENDCYHIAMESTGVYWRPVYEAIEEHSEYYEHLMVVNAHHMRNLPGRKNDVKDAEWIATLLRHGLLESSFVPERIVRNLREYSRLHRSFVGEKTRYLNRLEKFLQTHGFKLSSVLSNIMGLSGRNLLNTLVKNGCIAPDDVISAIGNRIKRPIDEIEACVCGKLNPYECKLLAHIINKIDGAEHDIDCILDDMEHLAAPYAKAIEQLDSIPGIDISAALAILAEISPTPQNSFETSAKLCAWAGLSPRNDESAGKIKSRKIMHGNPYIKSILCQIAWAAIRSRKTQLSAWFWSHQGKLGRKKAIIAVARKILALVYKLLKNDEFYDSNVALAAYSSPAE
jgi:transposase